MSAKNVPPTPNNPEPRKLVIVPSEITFAAVPHLQIDDENSRRSKFGWHLLGNEHIPYIMRGNNNFFSVRMIEVRIISKYTKFLHEDIFTKCLGVESFHISSYEAALLNEINNFHCDSQFGVTQFTEVDLVISSEDAEDLCKFLEFCLTSLTENNSYEKCGFVKIGNESMVPFVIKNNVKYVPLFYFEGETDKLKSKAFKLLGWELSYLKFLCRIQNIQNQLFSKEYCSVIDITIIIDHFPPNTTFCDDWPELVKQLLEEKNAPIEVNGSWIKEPACPPDVPKMKSLQINNSSKENSNNSKHLQFPNVLQRIFAPTFVLKAVEPNRLLNGTTVTFLTNKELATPSNEKVRFLIPIPDAIGRDTFYAYKYQRVIIDGRTIPCINMKPFSYYDLLMVCIIDLSEYLFKNIPFNICSSIIQALKIPLYRANTCQVSVFMASNRSRYCNSVLPLIHLKDIVQYLPQMRYMLASNAAQKLQEVIRASNQAANN